MYRYNICTVFDKDIFNKQCAALEKHIPNLIKEKPLEDVDGSQIQAYNFPNGDEIKVLNEKAFGVNVESEVKLEEYFN